MANPAMARNLGYASPEELIAELTDVASKLYVHPEDRRQILRLIDQQGFVKGFEVQQYRKDGSIYLDVPVLSGRPGRTGPDPLL